MRELRRVKAGAVLVWLALAGCGGGGGDATAGGPAVVAAAPGATQAAASTAATTATEATVTTATASPSPAADALAAANPVAVASATSTAESLASDGAAMPASAAATADAAGSVAVAVTSPAPATAMAVVAVATGSDSAAAESAPAPRPPVLPRAAITAAELAVVIAEGDAASEAIGLAYQRARGIPSAHVIRVPVPAGSDVIRAADFAALKAAIDARLPDAVQATLLTFSQPSRVQGETCAMGITSALAFGYDARWCGQCSRTQASPYYDSDSTRPWTELRFRPSMMLGARSVDAALALIQRGVAADGSQPSGTGYLLRTSDSARSVRASDYPGLPAAWSEAPGPALRYLDGSLPGGLQQLSGVPDLLFYFTGLARVPLLETNQFLPGAAADHLTSFGGLLPGGNGQMPATDWLAAGATASYGTVEEPCNYAEKFSRASVLIGHYLRGATLIEAYWKSVAWPGQGLFVGEPLARPWPDEASAEVDGGELLLRTRSLRRTGVYRVDHRSSETAAWRTLASMVAGQPRPISWRVPLPASGGGQLRWVGPCPTQPASSCVLAGPP